MNHGLASFPRLTALVVALVVTSVLPISALAAGNAACPGEDVFFNPANAQDIYVPPGYKVEVFASGLNFPAGIAFRGNAHNFEVFVTESGTGLPGRCNGAEFFKTTTGVPDSANPFLPQVRVLDNAGNTVRTLGRPTSVAARESSAFLHAPTIGITFEHDFHGGQLLVTDSRQGVRGALGPKNSSRIVSLDPKTGALTELIINLPTGDHPTEQITVKNGRIFWSQGSVTNSGVVGHDNGGPVGGPADVAGAIQHEIPCQDVVLSGNNMDSGDGHLTGGFLPHGVPGAAGQVVTAFSGASQVGMCSGAILTADLKDPQNTVRPVSWGYRNPFGIRFAPNDHPLKGSLFVTENGEDERGARPANNAPDRLQITDALENAVHGTLDFHGWPDRFGFLNSTQAIFKPVGGPADDNPAGPGSPVGKPVPPLLKFPPQPPIAPLAIEPADVAAVGADFAPGPFAGGGNPGEKVTKGDALVTREGDFGFSAPNGTPIEGHDIERVQFLKDGQIILERFAFNCKVGNQVTDLEGRKLCTLAENQAFVAQVRGINRPVDGKFGPDGAFYLVDFGAVRDFGRATPESLFTNPADAPLVQIPGTGVIWKISRQ
jgi:glucose/arabinose dehydrogenase